MKPTVDELVAAYWVGCLKAGTPQPHPHPAGLRAVADLMLETLAAEAAGAVDADGRPWGVEFRPDDLDWHHIPIGDHIQFWLRTRKERSR